MRGHPTNKKNSNGADRGIWGNSFKIERLFTLVASFFLSTLKQEPTGVSNLPRDVGAVVFSAKNTLALEKSYPV